MIKKFTVCLLASVFSLHLSFPSLAMDDSNEYAPHQGVQKNVKIGDHPNRRGNFNNNNSPQDAEMDEMNNYGDGLKKFIHKSTNNRPNVKAEKALNDNKITNIPRFTLATKQEKEKLHDLANHNYQLAFEEGTNTDFRSSSNINNIDKNTEIESEKITLQEIEKKHTYQHPLTMHLIDVTEKTKLNAALKLEDQMENQEDSNNSIQLQGYSMPKTAQEYYKEIGKEMPYASILSLDGGGFRGLMEAYWLDHLESKDVTNRKLHRLFNFISGTSIGGILALASTIPGKVAGSPALSTKEMIDLFVANGHRIFPQRYKYNYVGKLWDLAWGTLRNNYDERPLENLLMGYFSNMPLSSALTNVIVTSATAETQEPFLFSSFHIQRNHYEAWRVARATSAAPTYFKSFKFVLPGEFSQQSLVDGGLWLNNPSAIAYETALKWSQNVEDVFLPDNIVMLSLGTGKIPVQYRQPENAGKLNSIRPVIEAMMNYSTNGVDQSMREILRENYLRINPLLKKNIPLDCIDSQEPLEVAAKAEYEKIEDFAKEGQLRAVLERDEIFLE